MEYRCKIMMIYISLVNQFAGTRALAAWLLHPGLNKQLKTGLKIQYNSWSLINALDLLVLDLLV